MKKKTLILLSILFVFMLAAALVIRFTTNEFKGFLEDNHFTFEMKSSDLMALRDKYVFEGKKLSEITNVIHYNGINAGTSCYGGGNFGLESVVKQDGDRVVFSDFIHTGVKLGGLVLPYGIEFGDSIETVCFKVGFWGSPHKQFEGDYNGSGVLDLKCLYGFTLKLTDLSRIQVEIPSAVQVLSPEHSYMLEYAEVEEDTLEDGRPVVSRRYVQLLFEHGTNKLVWVIIGVKQELSPM